VRLDVENELVEVRALLHTRTFDGVGHATNRAEGSVELQASDRSARLFECRTLNRRPVTAAALDLEQHVELARLRELGNHEVGVDHLDIVVELNVASCDRTRPLLVQPQLRLIARIETNSNLLEVEQNVDDVLLNAFDARVLVEYPVDLRFGDRTARHGGK